MTDLIGIATWNFSEGTLAERIDRFAAMGYTAVSLIKRDAAALCRGETPDVEEAILRNSLPVTIHGGLGPRGEPIPKQTIEDFRLFTDWHARTGTIASVNFDAARVRTDTGAWVPRAEEMRDTLAEMLAISDGAGFTVGIEDWPFAAEHHRVMENLRVYPHYGMLIDLGHLNMRIRKPDTPDYPFPTESASEYLDQFTLPLNEIHVHNNDGRRDLHAPPTTGNADLPAVIDLLMKKGLLPASNKSFRRRLIPTIELVPAWCGLTEQQGYEAAESALLIAKEWFAGKLDR